MRERCPLVEALPLAAMDRAEQERDEEHHRKAEAAMLVVNDAARRLQRTANELRSDGAPDHMVDALETAAGSLSDSHKQLIRTTYWHAPVER